MEWNRWVELIFLSLITVATGIYPKATAHGEFHLSFGGETVSKKPTEVRSTQTVEETSTI